MVSKAESEAQEESGVEGLLAVVGLEMTTKGVTTRLQSKSDINQVD